jgi:hypothetical protein
VVNNADNGPIKTLAARNPALKLLPFYESLCDKPATDGLNKPMCTDKTSNASVAFKGLETLKDEWICGWVKEWTMAMKSDSEL